ncbi:MAG: NADPH-dependent F420 reductase [Rhodospirillaceae bacterium]|nr:NADPH-dependent F420 reductase [Rhodospirillaceae bacterium]|tara:strand:+ start:9484 stop:10176 length:693 start_codon:yes stop_codon:yes gene_type:complete
MGNEKPVIAVIGGTGSQGSGLAKRWARAGYEVIIGSRDASRAQQAAEEISEMATAASSWGTVRGTDNLSAATESEIAVLAVPFANQLNTLEPIADALKGKILIDVTAPLVPPKVGTVQLPEAGSAVLAAQDMLGEDVTVVAAFQNIAAQHLNDLDHEIDCDVLVCGNKKSAREIAIELAGAAGMTGWHAGPLANAAAAEAMTSVLIFINRAHKIPGSGIRITGTPSETEE